jgi:uncharacterized protein
MKIGVLSDTHLRSPEPVLDHILEELFHDADMILHAGDIVSRKVLERLEERDVLAVCGNMDDYEVADALPQSRIISAAGKRIGLMHGWGSQEGLAGRILMRFSEEKPDLIVYGHSHVPFWGKVEGLCMFNPGAASRNRDTGTATVGIIEIVEGSIEGRFLTVKHRQ